MMAAKLGLSKFDEVRGKMLGYLRQPRQKIMNMTVTQAQISPPFLQDAQEAFLGTDIEIDAKPKDCTSVKEIDESPVDNTSVKDINKSSETTTRDQRDRQSTTGETERNSSGPEEINYQPQIEDLKVKLRHLEYENTDLKKRIKTIHTEIKRTSGEREEDMKALKEQYDCLKARTDALEKENKDLRKSIVPPKNIDEWLGFETRCYENILMSDKCITNFSRVLFAKNLNITGSYFGFSDAEVHGILHDSNHSSRESCRLLLKCWCNKQGEKATLYLFLRILFKISQRESHCFDSKCLKDILQKYIINK